MTFRPAAAEVAQPAEEEAAAAQPVAALEVADSRAAEAPEGLAWEQEARSGAGAAPAI